jgi:hypothetical protein
MDIGREHPAVTIEPLESPVPERREESELVPDFVPDEPDVERELEVEAPA